MWLIHFRLLWNIIMNWIHFNWYSYLAFCGDMRERLWVFHSSLLFYQLNFSGSHRSKTLTMWGRTYKIWCFEAVDLKIASQLFAFVRNVIKIIIYYIIKYYFRLYLFLLVVQLKRGLKVLILRPIKVSLFPQCRIFQQLTNIFMITSKTVLSRKQKF